MLVKQRGKWDIRKELLKIKELFEKDQSGYTIIENTRQHQKDYFRCSLFGLYYIRSRVLGKKASDFSSREISIQEIDSFRKDMVATTIQTKAEELLKLKIELLKSKKTNSDSKLLEF